MENRSKVTSIHSTSKFDEMASKTISLMTTSASNEAASTKIRKFTRLTRTLKTESSSYEAEQRQDIQFRKTLRNVEMRGNSIFKFGFLSTEKKGRNKKIFADYFNIKSDDLKCSMSVGEMWSNKARTNFFVENGMKMNKVKLFEKMHRINKKEEKESRNILNENSWASSSCSNLSTLKEFPSSMNSSIVQEKEKFEEEKDANQELVGIRKRLVNLLEQNKKEQHKKIIKNLESCHHSMEKLESKYFTKLIEMF